MASKKTKAVKKSSKKVAKKPANKKPVNKKNVVKKTVKKSTSKKAPSKTQKVVGKKTKTPVKKKKSSKKILVVAMGDKYFWINNGPAVKDLVDLKNTLLNINKEQFLYHVNGMKNDFAIWVEEVLCDKKCADSIKKTKTISATIKNIEKALLGYHY